MTERITQWSGDDTQLLRPAASSSSAEPKTIYLDETGAPLKTGPRSTASAPPEIGVVLQGRFKLIELVGEGGMSRVYKAIDLRRVEARSANPFLAVKVLTVPFDDPVASMQLLEREAHKLQSLTHPNIVRVIDIDRDGMTVFMTMEFLSGESLLSKLRRASGSMTREQVQRVVAEIAGALQFAHRNGIVHGDLKPGNVIITEGGETKVIDFGIARFLGRPKDGSTPAPAYRWETISALTPPYASPEMIEGMEPDPRDDIYAFACITYEILTGEHPFARASAVEARDAGAKIARHPAMTGDQFQAITAGLRFNRESRTASVDAFLNQFSGERSKKLRWGFVVAGLVAVVAGVVASWEHTNVIPGAREDVTGLTAGLVFRDCATCPLMRVLAPGKFMQGSLADAAEQPPHWVTIPTAIAFAPREVTIAEFTEFANEVKLPAQGCNVYDGEWRWRSDISWDTLDEAHSAQHPVSCVSWDEATAYAAWLSRKTGQVYRLPSASEWEYAAGAGAASASPLASNLSSACKQANVADEAAARRYPGWNVLACDDRHAQSAPVASYVANAFGLHDMIGNVFEWVQDCWHDSYQGAPANGTSRSDGNCASRELRGGSWFTSPAYLRASYRNQFEHDYRSSSVGFRVAREIHQ